MDQRFRYYKKSSHMDVYYCVTAGARTDRTLGFYPQRIAYSASTP